MQHLTSQHHTTPHPGRPATSDSCKQTTRRLTIRETEILQLVCRGLSSKEVASTLCCSKRTVDCHLCNVYLKLRVSNRVQAFRRATELGMLSLADAA